MKTGKLLGFIAVIAMVGIACQTALAQPEAGCRCGVEPKPRIVTSGEGKVTAKPDEANITIGVTNEDRSLKKCFERQTADMNRVIEQVKAAGVKPEDIKSLGYNITPKTKDKPSWWGGLKPDSYQVAHSMSVKVRDLSRLGDIIDRVVESGANNINGLYFTSSKMPELEIEAKAKAVENARAKAEAMARGAGVKVGKVLEISDTAGPAPVYRMQAKAFAMAADNAAPPEIEPGSIEVRGSCTLVTEVAQ